MSKRLGGYCVITGLTLLVFGLVGEIISGGAGGILITIHLVLGGLLFISGLLFSGKDALSEAASSLSGRKARYAYLAAIYSLIFLVFLGSLNWLAIRFDASWDLTEQKVNSLSDQSRKVIDNLEQPLLLISFDNRAEANRLLSLYKERTNLVELRFVNAKARPELVQKYKMKPGNLLYLQYGDEGELSSSRVNNVKEEDLTNAILKLSRGNAEKIYYIEGHGEPPLTSLKPEGVHAFQLAAADEFLEIESLVLPKLGKIPEDASAIILAAPQNPMSEKERNLIRDFAQGGGALLLLHEPTGSKDIKKIAAEFGIKIEDNVVIDEVHHLLSGPSIGLQPMIMDYGDHPAVSELGEKDFALFSIASSVKIEGKNSDVDTYVPIALTGDDAWGETDLKSVFEADPPVAKFDAADRKGPVALGAIYERTPTEDVPGAKVIVFGDASWIQNEYFQLYSHRDLALNSLSWATGEESGVSIRPASLRVNLSPITKELFHIIALGGLLLPEIILLWGLFVWWSRRSRVGRVEPVTI